MPYNRIDSTVAVTPTITLDAGPLTSEGMVLSDMQDELGRRFGSRNDVDTDRLTVFINDAYKDLCGALVLPETRGSITFDLTVGAYVYVIPKTVRMIEDGAVLSNGNDRPLKLIDLRTYRKLMPQSDIISSYFRTGRNFLVVWPTPSIVETVNFDVAIRPNLLVLPDDSPILPEEYHEQLVKLAEAKGWSAIGEKTQGAATSNEVIADMRRKVDPAAEERGGMIAAFRSARHMRNIDRLGRNPDERGRW
jgi:hypothetical protein